MPAKRITAEKDAAFMALALRYAWAAKGKTFPNPAVGAVVVARDGRIVGHGATGTWGGPHAEKVALASAGREARGGTLYVTLEPCRHFGKTPPCTRAIIAAGIKRAVVAISDPNPLVRGKGTAELRRAGIRVDTGLLIDKAREINEDFFWAIVRKRAWITVKLALTLDGRIADAKGASQWITGTEARTFAHELRRRHAAVAVGRATLVEDDPRLTVRHKKGYRPARIVFTSSPDHIPERSYFARNTGEARSIVVVSGRGRRRIVFGKGIEYWYTGRKQFGKSLAEFTRMAFAENLTSVLVEGGQMLASAFLENNLVNRLVIAYGNKIVGNGKDGILFETGLGINKCIRLKELRMFAAGEDIVISGIPENVAGK
jgi:diaminohydroxyphosphoribosylaminopyrimidine deaminase / 5-amino-6-(5-phosphoribosylamino)uracil reductase